MHGFLLLDARHDPLQDILDSVLIAPNDGEGLDTIVEVAAGTVAEDNQCFPRESGHERKGNGMASGFVEDRDGSFGIDPE